MLGRPSSIYAELSSTRLSRPRVERDLVRHGVSRSAVHGVRKRQETSDPYRRGSSLLMVVAEEDGTSTHIIGSTTFWMIAEHEKTVIAQDYVL